MFELVDNAPQSAVIKVIGVGGGGSNAVDHMISRQVQGVDFVCANTDAQALSRTHASVTIQLGQSGLGAGSKPDKGREAAEAASDDIRQAIRGAHMLFITAGMGGGTGTGASPVVAHLARESGALTVAVVTKPFEFEGGRRRRAADAHVRDRLGGRGRRARRIGRCLGRAQHIRRRDATSLRNRNVLKTRRRGLETLEQRLQVADPGRAHGSGEQSTMWRPRARAPPPLPRTPRARPRRPCRAPRRHAP